MLKMLTLKQKMKKKNSTRVSALITVFTISSVLVLGVFLNAARADQFDAQIQALRDQNAGSQAAANQLQVQANSYQDAINKLQAQISALQAAINDNQQKIEQLKAQIAQAQADLEHEKVVLGQNIKAMYLEGKISTLEILASSNDISEFVNKEEYRNSVQAKVKTTLDKINALKQQLQQQQQQLESVVKDLQAQETALSANQAYTEGQKAAYDQQIKNNNSQIVALRAAQLAANRSLGGSAVAGDPGHGGYPAYLDRASQDSLVDPWGMFNRECVSYTAWKVYQTYGYMPYWGGVGNANQWPGDARAAIPNIPTGSIPKVHSVAISMGGAYGHAMWVEAVSGSMIYVSQYNYDLQGHYSEMWVNGGSFTYLYFGG
jgi:peptidoglycan hydrolase CwlO-like protein